jgi:hypothetical protein
MAIKTKIDPEIKLQKRSLKVEEKCSISEKVKEDK